MAIFIYNSLTRKKEEFLPLNPPKVNMYVCGPTVYDEPHIGHARSAYIFDVIRRYLVYKGHEVKFVRNVTDVDDKIIEKARKEYKDEDLNSAVRKVAEKYLKAYHEALAALNISSNEPDVMEPKATEYIDKMEDFIKNLISRGVAYESGGDVYFDIKKAKDYGKLSNQSLDKMESGVRVQSGENKRDPLDFTLWKAAKENEPSWDSDWGKGRPGWHIECSAMSSEILGAEFDIHGGGIDLIFPHHENEIAQSEGAGGKFARYWIHHGLLTINGQKMAKSLGNFITVKSFLDKYQDADLLKLFFLSAHYAHPVDYTDEKIEEAKKALERILILLDKVTKSQSHKDTSKKFQEIQDIKGRFIAAMDDDFNTPQGLAALFDLVNAANKNIDDAEFISGAKNLLSEFKDILGLELKRKPGEADLSADVAGLIDKRNAARKNGDFKEADRIRKELEVEGIILEDTKDGKASWRRRL
jgi:cysteinyl-tRNA synthetase